MSELSPSSMTGLEIGFGIFAVAIVVALGMIARARLEKPLGWLLPGLPIAWATWAFFISSSGVMASATRPPGILILVAPIMVSSIAMFGAGPLCKAMAVSVPTSWLIGLQAFRLGVEAALHALWMAGWVPYAMTLGSGNVELVFAASALVVAWLFARGKISRLGVRAWNVLGLLSLLNVVLRGIGSTPGATHFLHTELPNIALGHFPFTLIPALMVPLALSLHLVLLRATAAPRTHLTEREAV